MFVAIGVYFLSSIRTNMDFILSNKHIHSIGRVPKNFIPNQSVNTTIRNQRCEPHKMTTCNFMLSINSKRPKAKNRWSKDDNNKKNTYTHTTEERKKTKSTTRCDSFFFSFFFVCYTCTIQNPPSTIPRFLVCFRFIDILTYTINGMNVGGLMANKTRPWTTTSKNWMNAAHLLIEWFPQT